MKRTSHPKTLTLLISGLLVCLVVFWAQAQAKKKPTPTPTPEKKIKIADTILRREGKTKIILKPEFEAVKQSNNNATVRRFTVGTRQQPGIEGKFSCDCLSSKGACNLIIQGNSLECSGSCDSCLLTVLTR
jgi:hypothetical protein